MEKTHPAKQTQGQKGECSRLHAIAPGKGLREALSQYRHMTGSGQTPPPRVLWRAAVSGHESSWREIWMNVKITLKFNARLTSQVVK